MPESLLQIVTKKKAKENHWRSGDNLRAEYAPTYVEYKGGLQNNGRQAILDSAAVQAVNRVLDLHVTGYSLSIHHNQVDVITSCWDENPGNVNDFMYQYTKLDNIFDLADALGFLKFFSFLCQLRQHHLFSSSSNYPTSVTAITYVLVQIPFLRHSPLMNIRRRKTILMIQHLISHTMRAAELIVWWKMIWS
ncbi:hypothetical protein BT96DRAFT_376565 [Gymnopus androsaceus JB14]|uniref:Uncharacterized protein n=1 Tax=Gymnopus androsaceus JB14 TaxID=1447944 RepID=A0A6A4IN72_9AGAR|nr:hypothetical protein BT96DRAFT_376565 [Gymnopus androsaceus JB14]